jgi:hypothetical protein
MRQARPVRDDFEAGEKLVCVIAQGSNLKRGAIYTMKVAEPPSALISLEEHPELAFHHSRFRRAPQS